MGHYDEFYEAEAERRQRHMDETYEKCARCGKHITGQKEVIDGKPYHSPGNESYSGSIVGKPIWFCSIQTRLERLEGKV
jgi:hypothetical protein